MATGSIVFVHGTGVRLEGYRSSFDLAKRNARAAGIESTFVECPWGDPLGIEFKGLSLPDRLDDWHLAQESEDFTRWSWLYLDPLSEMEQLTIRDLSVPVARAAAGGLPGMEETPAWELKWDAICAYRPSDEMQGLLRRAGIDDAIWARARQSVNGPLSRTAFEHSAHELPVAGQALARATVAQLHHDMVEQGLPGPSREIRDRMVERLNLDWKVEVLMLQEFFGKMLKRMGTRVLRKHRASFTATIAPFIGDILMYQAHGDEIRDFIRGKIDKAAKPVNVVAHSLGGIACVDLLAMANPPEVKRLVTVGSQSPLFYEIGALASMSPPTELPKAFPDWLNIFDLNDMLSYIAETQFPKARDFPADSGQPFPDSHSAYFNNETVWAEINRFISQP